MSIIDILSITYPLLLLSVYLCVILCATLCNSMKRNIDVPTNEITAFCQRHHIRELSLFGSVLREDFMADSDVDVLVDFEPGIEGTLTLMDLAGMQIELSEILQRNVDLVLRDGLKPLLKDEILTNSEVVYAI